MKYQLPTRLINSFEARSWQFYASILCYVLIAIGIFWRVYYISDYNPIHEIWSDPQRHYEQGLDLLRDDPMAMTDPILYQLYIAALLKLSLSLPILVAFYTSLLSIITPWIWYRFFRELQPNKLCALMGWAALSLTPDFVGIYGYFMQETLLLPLLGLALYCTWRCRRKQQLTSFLLMMFVWSLAGLTRGICIPMAAVATLWIWIEQPQKLSKFCFGMLLLGLILGPLTYRGYEKMNIFAPHGIGHMNMIYTLSGNRDLDIRYYRNGAFWRYVFTSPALNIKPFEPISDWTSSRQGVAIIAIDITEGSAAWDRVYEQFPLTASRYLWIVKENLINLFFSPSWPDSNRERFTGEVNFLIRWLWLPLTLLVVSLTLKKIRAARIMTPHAARLDVRSDALLLSLFLIWLIVQGLLPISINEGRYRKPLTGILIGQLILLAGTRQRKIVSAESVASYGSDYFQSPNTPKEAQD